MSAPLPPRPGTLAAPIEQPAAPPEVKHEPYISEKTKLEMEAGKEAVALSRKRLEEEMEAGRRAVALNEQQRRNRTAI